MAAAVTVETAAAWVRWRHHQRCRSGSQADVFNYPLLPVTATSISVMGACAAHQYPQKERASSVASMMEST
eukprot:2717089-Pleurochrysis_carterae.AAC.1